MTERMIIETASERIAYGYRRIWALLRNEGIHANRKTVRTIMYLAPKEFRNRWSSDPGFRAQYLESLEKGKEKKRSRRENRKKMEVKANGI